MPGKEGHILNLGKIHSPENPEAERRETKGWLRTGARASLWGDEDVLEQNGGLNSYVNTVFQKPVNCTFKRVTFMACELYVQKKGGRNIKYM
jgi:hypothetical protein